MAYPWSGSSSTVSRMNKISELAKFESDIVHTNDNKIRGLR